MDNTQNTEGREINSSSNTLWPSSSDVTPMSSSDSEAQTQGNKGNQSSAAHSLKEQAKDAGQHLVEKYKGPALDAVDRAKTQVKDQLSGQMDKAADTLGSATRALESTGQQFRDQNLAIVADYADSFASQVQRATNYLRDKNIEEVGRDIEQFARQNPAVFIGGAFLLGVAAARFLKSSEAPSPMDAFSRERMSGSYQSNAAGMLPAPESNHADEFGARPLTAHNYVPGMTPNPVEI
jgi:hypothetical protein